jgi:ATP-dependent NAD(P)H-hydrate dehydratase
MVHPYMRQTQHRDAGAANADQVVVRVAGMLDRLHAIVVGPGLGRDELMQESAGRIISEAKKREMPIVVDAVWAFFL